MTEANDVLTVTDIYVAFYNDDRCYLHHDRGRVTETAIEIGRLFGFGLEKMLALAHGAILHDVGKLMLPPSIINKPQPLTKNEWTVVHMHHLLGWSMSQRFAEDSFLLDGILFHHENWDGSGYPFGLAGREIPLHARILAVADVFDALQVDRPYRSAFSFREACRFIIGQKGRKFDPDVVEALVCTL